ncbi:cache domain-containing protein [Methylomarinum sp. Ch1-1]|uniref:Cache domain-containing protein n=1 Tax=Methylomarinum roseum TaxID=3067653 RepID=A0AAU7NTF3_9GAMM|nr:cache domain-containing protein [Methylomarinum sp. Ch1-1]MDP4519673.1 cache domain-containing protein [Methylomarinum sp. Ch1-1]
MTKAIITSQHHIRWRLLIPLLMIFTLMIILSTVIHFVDLRSQFKENMTRELTMIATNHRISMTLRGEKLSALAETLSREPRLVKALAAGDRDALMTLALPQFERFKKAYNISHFYFHDARRQTLLRLHNPSVYGDRNDRVSAQQAERTGQTAVGVGLGKTGTYTQRAVAPVKMDGRLIGYLELGEETLDSLLDLAHDFNVEGYVLLYKDFLDRQDWEQFMLSLNRTPDWERYPDRVLAAQTQAQVPEFLDSLLKKWGQSTAPHSQIINAGARTLNVGAIPLFDAGDRQIGQMLILRDVSALNQHIDDNFFGFVISVLAGGLLLSLVLYYHLRKTEYQLRQAHKQILEGVNEREADQRRHIEELTERINDLERFERLTVHRELRIQTLKQENRRLKTLVNADLTEREDDHG